MTRTKFTNLRKGTTAEQWNTYYRELSEFEQRMESRKPRRHEYGTKEEYEKALLEHSRALSMDAPNEPGYFRANND